MPWLLLACVCAGVLAAYSAYIVWMVGQWSKSEYYSHGFLVAPISALLIWRRREELTRLPQGANRWGLAIVAACLLVYLGAIRLDVHFAQGFSLVGLIWGLVWWLGGWPLARAVAFPVAFLLFMVPLERLLVDVFAQPLQLRSAQAAGLAARFIGIPVAIEGTRLVTPEYTFSVAIACSGLKTAISLSALGALMAYMFEGVLWRRVLLFALSIPVALVANASRIWLTLVLAASLGPRMAEGFFHSLSGFMVFLVAVLGLLGVGRLIGCRQMRDDIW